MNSIKFPDMFSRTSTNMVYDRDATEQNVKMTLYSNKGEMFGDPYYGSTLKKILFDQNDTILKDILVDDVYSAVRLFIPQLSVERKDISIVNSISGEVTINIKAINKADFSKSEFSIVMLKNNS